MTTGDQGLTAYAADFAMAASLHDIPDDVTALGKTSILDGLGCALAGADTPTLRILHAYYAPFTGLAGQASVIGSSLKLPPRFAALVNGTSMHVDDYDDTQQAATGKFQGVHPTAPVLSAVLAAGEVTHASGEAVLLAYHVGVELACKLFDATHPNHILHGFHATGTCGLVAAAIACAKLRGAGLDEMRRAIGIASSQAAGLQENFGTMTKPFHAGRSAEGGIVSADLAALGFTASTTILEAPRGFFQAEGGGWERERIERRLGQPWAFVDRGVWLKPWPTGSLSHPAMTLMLQLLERHDIQPGQIAAVRIRTSENIHRTLLHHHPRTELEAKFSLEFCTAALAFERRLGLTSFTDDFVCRADVQDLISRVEYTTFTEAEARAAGFTIVTSFVEIVLRDGRVHGGRLDFGKGSKADPMTPAEVEAKFRDCAAYASWAPDRADRIVALVYGLERVRDVGELAECLALQPDAAQSF